MTYDDWLPQYRKLVRTYNRSENGEQCVSFFEALRKFTPLTVERGVARAIAEEKHWPSPAELREHCAVVLKDLQAPTYRGCATCHDEKWVDAPDQEQWGRVYRYVRACPDCQPGHAA